MQVRNEANNAEDNEENKNNFEEEMPKLGDEPEGEGLIDQESPDRFGNDFNTGYNNQPNFIQYD